MGDLKVTLDANWRWLHHSNSTDNCYEGDRWDSTFCSDPLQCARDCVLEGVTLERYQSTYGIEQIENGVKLNFVTDHEHGTNVGSRLYMLDESGEKYKMFYLKNREFAMTFDVSHAFCGMNGAMYFVEMDQDGGKGLGANAAGAAYGTGYCDAQCPHDIKFISGEANVIDWSGNPDDPNQNMGVGKYGSCCAEMDIWEANSMANAYTPHPCDVTGQLKCEGTDCGDNVKGERYDGVCDKDGCDINPYRMGNRMFFGRGSQYEVDTLKPVTVVTQFLTTDGTDDGQLSEMRRFYVQDGNVIQSPSSTILGPDDTDTITDAFCQAKKTLFGDVNDYAEKGGSAAMGESLDRGHVMAISLWDAVAGFGVSAEQASDRSRRAARGLSRWCGEHTRVLEAELSRRMGLLPERFRWTDWFVPVATSDTSAGAHAGANDPGTNAGLWALLPWRMWRRKLSRRMVR